MKEKKIEDYIHLYLGCECLLKDVDPDIDGRGILVNIDLSGGICVIEDMSINYCVEANVSDIKPLLRPLSSMTEEEARELFSIEADGAITQWPIDFDVRVSGNAWRITRLDRLDKHLFINWYGNIWKVVEDGEVMIDVVMHQTKLYAYLLSKGFDLFELIPSGLALDKTLVKN